jgi:tetratricopeptide (TPR) repeat protein
MMTPKQRAIVWLLVVILAVPGLASAIRKGRLVGRVLDPEGHPISGVTVTATSPDVPDFLEVMITDAKGTFKVDFDTLDVTYHYKFEKAGYLTLEVHQDWSLEGTERKDFTMNPGNAMEEEDVPLASSSSPAIRAYNSGVTAYEAEDYATAAAKFEEAVGQDPKLRQGWGALSLVCLKLGRDEQAAEAAEKAIALGSTSVMVLQTRWEAYRNLGDEAKAAEAQKDLEETGILAEEAKRVYNEGVGLLKAGDEEGAYAKFQEAVEFDANLREAQLAVATTALKVGHYAEAAAAAQAVLDENPQDEEAIKIRYNACLALGDDAKLIDALLGLAAFEPDLARDGLWKLALESYDGGDMTEAGKRFRKVLEVDPNYPWANYLLGLVVMDEGDKEEAIRYLERFIQLAPNDPETPSARDLVAYLKKGES